MDLNDVEAISFNALGGADTITVNDMSGTDVTEVNIDLAGAGGGWRRRRPTRSSSTPRTATTWSWCSATPAASRCSALPPQINITGFEAANDRLVINALAGDDVIEASGLAAGASSSRRTAATATTSSSAATATTSSSAAPATTC